MTARMRTAVVNCCVLKYSKLCKNLYYTQLWLWARFHISAAASAYNPHHPKLTWKVQTFWKVQSVSTPQAIKTRLISIYSRLPGQKIIITINWPKEAEAEEEFNKLFLILYTTTSWWPEPHHNLQVKIRLEQNSFIQWCYWCSLYFVHTGHFLG